MSKKHNSDVEILYDLEEELVVWAETYGSQRTSKKGSVYYSIDYKNNKRRELFIVLIEKLKELGAEKDTFKGGPTRDKIIKFSLPPKHTLPGKKYSNAIMAAAKDLNSAIIAAFGTDSEKIKKGEQKPKITQARDVKKLSLEEKIKLEEDKEIEEELSAFSKNNLKKEEKEIEKPFTKEFNPKRITDEPPVIVETDPELDALLGFGRKDE